MISSDHALACGKAKFLLKVSTRTRTHTHACMHRRGLKTHTNLQTLGHNGLRQQHVSASLRAASLQSKASCTDDLLLNTLWSRTPIHKYRERERQTQTNRQTQKETKMHRERRGRGEEQDFCHYGTTDTVIKSMFSKGAQNNCILMGEWITYGPNYKYMYLMLTKQECYRQHSI